MNNKQPLLKIWFQKTVLSNKKLRDEVFVAFGLIVVALLVLVGYLFPGVASIFEARTNLPVVALIIGLISVIGFLIIIQIVEPVVKISKEAKLIAKGEVNREITLRREDELGELGTALNTMTRRIRENVEELKELSKVAETLNNEISSKITMLSSLMEISNSIAQNVALDDIIDIAVKKCLDRSEMTLGAVILKNRITDQFEVQYVLDRGKRSAKRKSLQNIPIQLGVGLLGKAILKQEQDIIDGRIAEDKEIQDFQRQFLLKNAIIAPVSSKGNAYGLLIIGNDQENFIFTDTDRELIQLVAKHIAIAVLNFLMAKEIEKFAETDALTGLFNSVYARRKLHEEVTRALNFQKPCSFVLLCIDRFAQYLEHFGQEGAQEVLVQMASILQDHLKDEDLAARFAKNEFALILPGRSKKESIDLAQGIIQRVQQDFGRKSAAEERITATAAVVENPIDGMSADELILKSGVILNDTVEQGGNRVGHQV